MAECPSKRTNFEELVTCAVCYELLDDPKVFPCLHSYCYKCIVKLSKRESGLECPECLAPVKPGHLLDLSKLPTNFFANNVLATLSLTENSDAPALVCDNCGDQQQTVEKRCKDCLQFLCNSCAESHQRSGDTRSHFLLSKDKLKNNKPAENARAVKCSVHRNELIKFYCRTCKMTICINCTVLEHKEHSIESVEESAAKAKDEVQTLVREVEEKIERISDEIQHAVERNQDIADRKVACNAQIEAFFAQLHKEIEDQKLKMLKTTASSVDKQKKKLEDSEQVLNLARSTCENGVNFAMHTLENGNDVQLLSLKPDITWYLDHLKGIQDKITQNPGNPICFVKRETPSISQLGEQLTTDVCSVEEVKVCAEKCEAKLTDPLLKVGKKSVIIITSKDNDGRIISSSCGKDLVEPNFSGVSLQDIEISENEDGTYEISFVVKELGTLHFGAKINGYSAPGCSVNANVNWEMDYKHGCGYLRMSNGQIFNCMSGEGDVGKYCYRLGNSPMTSGVHHWRVEVCHEVQDAKDCPEEPKFQVGVIEKSKNYPEASVTNGTINKWIFSGRGNKIVNISLSLDMDRKRLEIVPKKRFSVKGSMRRNRRTLDVNANSVLPFFSVNCPHCSLTFF